jgi:hypothetical protein
MKEKMVNQPEENLNHINHNDTSTWQTILKMALN